MRRAYLDGIHCWRVLCPFNGRNSVLLDVENLSGTIMLLDAFFKLLTGH